MTQRKSYQRNKRNPVASITVRIAFYNAHLVFNRTEGPDGCWQGPPAAVWTFNILCNQFSSRKQTAARSTFLATIVPPNYVNQIHVQGTILQCDHSLETRNLVEVMGIFKKVDF